MVFDVRRRRQRGFVVIVERCPMVVVTRPRRLLRDHITGAG
ncbi:MAG TPA: hypothetical protein VGQ44_05355 [Gemmatimonadaceae bacterium]|nr:hypothetical protein [Gemmatimonadaceae bacterium]